MSLFPDVDDEINLIKKKKIEELKEWADKQIMFAPSNGSEAMMFDGVCDKCRSYNYENPSCNTEVMFWAGEPQKEIVVLGEEIKCIKHSSFDFSYYMKHS